MQHFPLECGTVHDGTSITANVPCTRCLVGQSGRNHAHHTMKRNEDLVGVCVCVRLDIGVSVAIGR